MDISNPIPENESQDWDKPLVKTMLPPGSMQHFQDEAAWFFQRYTNPVVGYIITEPDRMAPIGPHTKAAAAACIVVKHEEDFDRFSDLWQHPSIYNVQSKDLTECFTIVEFTCLAGEAANNDGFSNIHIPDCFIDTVIYNAADTGHLAVVLCSPTRSLLFVFPFDDDDLGGLQAASVQSTNWRPYRVYDEETLNEAARKYGHLSKRSSEGWGMEIPSFFTEEEAKALREES